ncbi:hypothetical protein NQZ68_008350 [Dissostichus eleginoides]|nr:hypothetical protein NQZ68_008350 [Dissostichus eleginoides]
MTQCSLKHSTLLMLQSVTVSERKNSRIIKGSAELLSGSLECVGYQKQESEFQRELLKRVCMLRAPGGKGY